MLNVRGRGERKPKQGEGKKRGKKEGRVREGRGKGKWIKHMGSGECSEEREQLREGRIKGKWIKHTGRRARDGGGK